MLVLPRSTSAVTPYHSLALVAAFLATLAAFAVLVSVATPLARSTDLGDTTYEVRLEMEPAQPTDGAPLELESSPPPLADLPNAPIGGFQTITVPDIIPSQIPPPGEVAFRAQDFSGLGIRAGYSPGAAARPAPSAPQDRGERRYRGSESYNRIDENDFLAARSHPLSTFAVDVDRASYANVRRFLDQGRRPPVDAVRIEELVNYFAYDYDEPRDGQPFAVSTEVARAPWARTHRLVRVAIQGRHVRADRIPPSNLVFLIDVSGSMSSPDKLPLLQSALRLLVRELREEDRVAVVVYAGAAGLVLPSTSGANQGRILRAIERLEAGGSTAGGAGLRLAYDIARESRIEGGNNRVILATDGDFNVGPSSDADMIRLIEQKREQGTFLTVLGFGEGNLKDAKMEQMADHGNGNYAYIDRLAEARKVLIQEMSGTLLTIAKDVKVQVEFNPARVSSYRLIGYENRAMAAEDFANDRKDGGEIGAGHSVTALYEVVPVGAEGSVGPLRYQDPPELEGEHGDELLLVKLRYKDPEGSESKLITRVVPDASSAASTDLRFAAAVAAFGMVLRDSPRRGDFGFPNVSALARGAVGTDRDGLRAQFLELVEAAARIEDMDAN